MKVRYPKGKPLLPVLTPVIGHLYHLSWAASNGMQWILIGIEGDTAVMQTPVTKKVLRTKLKDLMHIRSRQARISQGKQKQ